MKNVIVIVFFCVCMSEALGQNYKQNFVTYDIDNFWNAYDKINSTKDTVQQYSYLNKIFIEPGSPGLKSIMQVRDYTAKSYIDAIKNYPLFWNSVRPNTLKAKIFIKEIEDNIDKLKILYPDLKPARVYFTIGALRTNGTTMNDMVLIGSELAMADKNTIADEFGELANHRKSSFSTSPINDVVFVNVHEYVHTQQDTTIGDNLLAQTVLEGVAEFVAVKATGKQSVLQAFSYGRKNNEKVKQKFSTQMFNSSPGFWLYSNVENEFKVRDLGYYVGYVICEKYYESALDKKQAIKEMIELNYNNKFELENFVSKSGYFSKSFSFFKNRYENSRPRVINIREFKNNSHNVNPELTQITVEFSDKMDKHHRNFELGPLGVNNLLRVKKFISFSDDGKAITFEVKMKPNQKYQLMVGEGFINENGINLKPYLINIKTADK